MGRKTRPNTNKGKEKRQQRKEEAARIAVSQDLVNKANNQEDPLLAFPVFRKFDKNDLTVTLECKRSQNVDPAILDWAFQLLKENMQAYYEDCEWGWSDKEKREEMVDDMAWLLVAQRTSDDQPVAFSLFRFDLDYGDEVLYWSTAEELLKHFLDDISPLPLYKLIQVSMDGPNVNLKFITLLQEHIKSVTDNETQEKNGTIKKNAFNMDERKILTTAMNWIEGTVLLFQQCRNILTGVKNSIIASYELQLCQDVRRKGLGKFMLQLLELLAFSVHMKKVILTVLKHNPEAVAFFTALNYKVDETSPEDNIVEQYHYQILSKMNKRLLASQINN
uniref:N-alpha-acetyltransferase 40 n=1 Tax=Timema monikensis TaxID=170555 RepID=A0A7R9EEI4_9NEOP|nr:unnamed protein product [Timema monikensis]